MRTYSHLHQIFMLWLVAAVLMGCSSLGGVTPEVKSAKDGVAVSYAAIEGGAEVTTDLLKEGLISTNKARFCQAILERAYALTEIAEREALAGKPAGAKAILATVSRLLVDVQGYLGREF